MDASELKQIRIYKIQDSVFFRDNAGEYGGLSNMSIMYPLEVNGIRIKSVEALYQACKFPHDPDLQRRILAEPSPFTAKMITKGKTTRSDWMKIRVKVMKWCLAIKLAQNYISFGDLLRSTAGKNIVEYSKRDSFWGANRVNENEFKGVNALGRLLMELRENYATKSKAEILNIRKLEIENFLLLGRPIETIDMSYKYDKL